MSNSQVLHRAEQRGSPVTEFAEFARPATPQLLVAILLGAGAIGAGIGLLATAAWLISRASQHPRESAVALGIVAVQFFGLSRGLFRYAHRLVVHDAALRALRDLRVQVYDRLEALLPSGARWLLTGDLMARFVADVESLQDLLVRVISPFAIALLIGAATIALLWWILPAAGLIMAVALLLAGTALPWTTARLAARREAGQGKARGELTAAVVDLIQGAPELVAYDGAERYLARAAAIDEELAGIERKTARTAGVGQGFATLLPAAAMLGSLVAGITAVRGGRLDIAFLAVIAVVPLAAFELAGALPAAAQAAQRVGQSLGRTREVLHAPPAMLEPQEPKPLPNHPFPLRVRDLRCRYDDDGPWVLDGLDLDLEPGRRVAIVGRSGAGKSTLADVLLRFTRYQGGSITLGGVELADLDGDDCRQVVGLVSQDAHIFNATLRANLCLACHDGSDEQLLAALRRVRLLEWCETLPEGLETELGEFGSRISGGQRQRVAVARALLADFPMLVLDEPGEHLETETADLIVRDLLDNAPEQAILLITHRLKGLEGMDEVIVLEAGRVVERGTHEELIRANRAYAEIWEREEL